MSDMGSLKGWSSTLEVDKEVKNSCSRASEQALKDYDWRSDIKELSSLNDVDPFELLIYLRHQYLNCAKDLIGRSNPTDHSMGLMAAQVAENIQIAIECHEINHQDLNSLEERIQKEPASFNFSDRAQEKAQSRKQDQEDLRKENGRFVFPNAKVLWNSAKRLW